MEMTPLGNVLMFYNNDKKSIVENSSLFKMDTATPYYWTHSFRVQPARYATIVSFTSFGLEIGYFIAD